MTKLSLVERLRRHAPLLKASVFIDAGRSVEQAAARIEALEKALAAIRDHDGVSYRFGDEVRAIALAAIEGDAL